MTITIQNDTYDISDFLFRKPDLKEYNSINQHSIDFLNEWISGKKEFTINTSGTTGLAKSIVLKRKWLEVSALQTISILKLWDEKVLCCIPIYKVGGLMMVIRSLAGGFDLKIAEPTADPMLELAEDHSFTFVSLVPYQLSKILLNDRSRNKLNRFKNILLGGSEIPSQLIKEIESLAPNIYHTYGMTETCSHIALKKLNHQPWPHFIPNPGVELLVDPDGILSVKALQTGGNLIKTSDIIKLYEDGSFDFMGRKDFVINSGGFKIFPERLEQKVSDLLLQKGITLNLAFTSVPHSEWGEQLILVIENKIVLDYNIIIEILKDSLEKYEVPKRLIYLDKIPLNDGGKIERFVLKNQVLMSFNQT